jgi:hypothetical protein
MWRLEYQRNENNKQAKSNQDIFGNEQTKAKQKSGVRDETDYKYWSVMAGQ